MGLATGRLFRSKALKYSTLWIRSGTLAGGLGVTRGKKLVVLIGQKKAIAIAVRNVSGRRRWSKLDDWLRLGASRAALLAPVAN